MFSIWWSPNVNDVMINTYETLVKGCNNFGIIVLAISWIVTTGDFDVLISKSYFIIGISWIISFIVSIVTLIIKHFRKKRTVDSELVKMPKRCLIRCLVAMILWWIVL
jgi:hypothetical protein